LARLAISFDRPKAGSSMAARMAMIAITTSNSISVNPVRWGLGVVIFILTFRFVLPVDRLR